jgi:hypothetical protein
MKVEFLAVCDYATSDRGKLTLIGIFDVATAPIFPFRLSNLGVGARLRLDESEARTGRHSAQLSVKDPQGVTIGTINADITTAGLKPVGGGGPVMHLAFNIPGIELKSAGRYVLTMIVDRQLHSERRFDVAATIVAPK